MPDKSSIGQVYLALRGRLSRLVAGIVPPAEIEDIVQETYVRVCQVGDGSSIRAPQSFLMTTARNLALDHAKRAQTRLTSSIDDAPARVLASGGAGDEPGATAASDEEFAHFCEAVRQLPQQCRRVFVLKKVYGYTQREIAQELRLSESTVEKHVANGMRQCAIYMRRRCGAAAGTDNPDRPALSGNRRGK